MLRRLRPDEKAALTASLFRVKESSGRTFLRKAVFLQRSQEVVTQVSDLLKDSTDGKVEDKMFDLLSLLGEDLTMQRELDDALTRGIIGAATKKRWVGSAGEKTILRKCCRFVEGRMGILDACYGKVDSRHPSSCPLPSASCDCPLYLPQWDIFNSNRLIFFGLRVIVQTISDTE